MTIVVDANIVFSAILNTDSRIGQLLLNPKANRRFIAPDYLLAEIHRHHDKICTLTGLTPVEVLHLQHAVCSSILFISEEQTLPDALSKADEMVKDVDPKDAFYIALSVQFKSPIWSGDKKLIAGLEQKGFDRFITTDQLFSII